MEEQPLFIGSSRIIEDVLQYSFKETSKLVECKRTWHGPITEIHASRPKLGTVWKDVSQQPVVEEIEIKEPAPEIGVMVVTERKTKFNSNKPTYELLWTQQECPLELAPYFNLRDSTHTVTISKSLFNILRKAVKSVEIRI